MKENILKELERVREDAKDLVFESFNNDTAWTIGNMIYERAKKNNLGITISITLGGQKLFYYSFAGTTPDNDNWVRRKENTVYRFFKSSYEMTLFAASGEENFMEFYGLNNLELALAGGSVPVVVKNTGVVGTITVSGLAQHEDHNLVSSVIREYLGK